MSAQDSMTTAVPAPALPPSGLLIRTLGVIAMLSGFLVVLVYQVTLPYIEENKRLAIERAVFQLVPSATVRHDFVVNGEGLFPAASGKNGFPFYAAYDADGNLKGIAAEAAAQGYADMVRMLFGYDPNCECITGFTVLKMAETPGLGDKILSDGKFLANFEPGLEARVNGEMTALANAIVTVKHGTKKHAWQIDAISGATVTSKAVGKGLNDSAQKLLPLLLQHVEALKQAKQKRLAAETQRRGEDS